MIYAVTKCLKSDDQYDETNPALQVVYILSPWMLAYIKDNTLSVVELAELWNLMENTTPRAYSTTCSTMQTPLQLTNELARLEIFYLWLYPAFLEVLLHRIPSPCISENSNFN